MIPAEAVEAAAKAIFAQQYDPDEWTSAVIGTRDRCKRDAQAALEAAVPGLMAAAWEEGRQAEEDASPLTRSTPNPYDAADCTCDYAKIQNGRWETIAIRRDIDTACPVHGGHLTDGTRK